MSSSADISTAQDLLLAGYSLVYERLKRIKEAGP